MKADIRPLVQRTFELRRATLCHIANLSPNHVSAAYIAHLTNAHLRTSQRALQVLSDWACLTGDGHHPISYKLNEGWREELGL